MAELLRFHVRIYARPVSTAAEPTLPLGKVRVTPQVAPQAELLVSWPITFDAAAERLGRLPRMFLEPDGSFVWVMEGEPACQVNGVLYDRGPRLAYVELRGCCDWLKMRPLLEALGWPETPLLFELVNEAILLDDSDFRRAAAT